MMTTQPTVHPILNGLTNHAFRRRSGRIKFIDIVPPIEQEILDDQAVQNSFSQFPLIPYSGNDKVTSHKLVNLLYQMKNMATTFGAVIELKKTYAAGGELEIVRQRDTVFNLGDEAVEVQSGEKRKFIDTIHKNFIFKQGNLKKLSLIESECYNAVGYIAVKVTTTYYLGVTKVCVQYLHPTDICFYKNSEPGTEIAISPRWDESYLREHNPEIIPVYPLERVFKDGTTETIFFVKNGGYLYGRPSDMAAIHDKYNEFKLKQFTSKKCKKLFMPDAFIEYEDGQMAGGLLDDAQAQAAGHLSAADRINDRFTNEGDDPQGIFVTTRPEGAKPAFIHEFGGLKNAEDLNAYLAKAEESILRAGNVPEMLYKLSGATGFSNDVFMDVFNIFHATFNNEHQTLLEGFNNEILNYGFMKLGIENILGINYTSSIQTLLNEYNERKRSSEIQSSVQKLDGKAEADLRRTSPRGGSENA